MLRSAIARSGLIAALFATTACTQAPAPVELLGQNNYGRSGVSYASTSSYAPAYASNNGGYSDMSPAAGVSQETTQAASVSSIGVSDLAPPSSSVAPAAKPEHMAYGSSNTPRLNPWTRRPHTVGDQSTNLTPVSKSDLHTRLAAAQDNGTPGLSRIVDNNKAPAKAIQAASGSFMWPVSSHRIISGFGPKGGGKVNDGINIASAEGEPVWAAADGEVVYAGNELAGYGNMVLIKHSGGKTTTYAHMNRIAVDKYEHVKQGDIIGYVGSTGNVKSPQLHFAIRDGKDPLDPAKFLSTRVASN